MTFSSATIWWYSSVFSANTRRVIQSHFFSLQYCRDYYPAGGKGLSKLSSPLFEVLALRYIGDLQRSFGKIHYEKVKNLE